MSSKNILVGMATSEAENAMNVVEMCAKEAVELLCYLKELAGQNTLGWHDPKGPTIGEYHANELGSFCIQNDEGNINGFIFCGDHRFFVGAFPTVAEAEIAIERATKEEIENTFKKEMADLIALEASIKEARAVENAPTQSEGKVHKDAVIKRINKTLEPRGQKLHYTRKQYVEKLGQYHVQDDVLDVKIGNINLIALALNTNALGMNESIVY